MNRFSRSLLVAATVLCAASWSGPVAQAQFGGDRIRRPLDRPTVSPYVNLFRRGNTSNPILNYYGAVRPQQQFYAQDRKLSRGLEQTRRQIGNRTNRFGSQENGNRSFRRYRMSITGHPAGFMTFGGAGGNGDDGGGGGAQGQGDDQQDAGANLRSGHTASFGAGTRGFGSDEF